jgi:Uma2 family endonuclease
MGGSLVAMTVVTDTKKISADEYLATPDDRPRCSELIDGEVVVNTPSSRHQDVLGSLYFELVAWTRAAPDRGKPSLSLDLRLVDDHVYAPDVLWFAATHVPAGETAYLDGPPDLAVEVRSPSTWRFDIGVKKSVYERAGLPELWLVDTRADTVLVYRRSSPSGPSFDVALELAAGESLTSPQLDGFALDIVELFAR